VVAERDHDVGGGRAGALAARVLIESGDGSGESWSTVGVDENIIAASWHALEEALTYCLLRSGREPS
jgi:LeuA allosteric (dimerisation) domain